eukprot:scaffold117761_cov42-Attheya_sp.AAC.1
MILADFSGSNPISMETMNDPVMGGTSFSSAKIDGGTLVWQGEVHIVSFLQSPGFCIVQTSGRQHFSGLGDTSGISFIVKDNGNMILPMGAQISTGAVSSKGYPVTYVGTLAERNRKGGFLELYAPWDSFKANFRGQVLPDAPPLEKNELNKTNRIGLSTYQSHTAGAFRVDISKIVAGISEELEW